MTDSTKKEFLEVVDEKNQVIGKASRWDIHRKSLRHRSVHIFIFNSEGKLYLQKRSPNKDQYPGHWDSSAAGHTDPGETPGQSAHRELMEELGLEAELTEVLRHPACPETGWEFTTLFAGRSDDPVRLNLQEATTGGFFSPEEIDRLLSDPKEKIAPGFRLLHASYQCQTASISDRGILV
jgi:16S rRNA (adenine1518-N6/adenine1519-N6)-dimethyltransferase